MGTIQQPKAKEEVQKDNPDSMLLLKITGMALLVAPAMAAYCDSLIGTKFDNFDTEVRANSGLTPGCGASRCVDPDKWVGRVWARKDYCEDNGMRLCTIKELKDGHAQGTGCQFDAKDVWSSTSCLFGRWTYNWAEKKKTCKNEDDNASIRCCADDNPQRLTCPKRTDWSDLMKAKKTWGLSPATCVLCSGCDHYEVPEPKHKYPIIWTYMNTHPYCAHCRKRGMPTRFDKRTDFSGPYDQYRPWKCLFKEATHMPAQCVDEFRKCDQHLEVSDRSRCDKFYSSGRSAPLRPQ